MRDKDNYVSSKKGKNQNQTIVLLKTLPNWLVNIFYNPDDTKRKDHPKFKGAVIKFTFSRTVCYKCKNRGHWGENCTHFMQEKVNEHGPHLHCKNIRLLTNSPSPFYRRKADQSLSVNIVTRANEISSKIYLAVVKDKKKQEEPKKDGMLFFEKEKGINEISDNHLETQQVKDLIQKISSSSKEIGGKIKWTEFECKEELIEKDQLFLDERLDEEIRKKNLNMSENFKNTVLYKQVRTEVQKDSKAELLFKCYILSLLLEKNPTKLIETKMNEIEEKIKVLKKDKEKVEDLKVIEELEFRGKIFILQEELKKKTFLQTPFLYIGTSFA